MTDNKTILFFEILFIVLVACTMFIAWRLKKLQAQRAEAARRAADAFEQMNKLTRELRDKRRETPVDSALTPGQRLLQMYPGAKRGETGGSEPA